MLSVLFFWLANVIHPFHVSVCDMTYVEDDRHLKISMSLFLDDMEDCLIAYTGNDNLDIMNMAGDSAVQQSIGEYLTENLQIQAGKRNLSPTYLGSEVEVDVIWCYLEVRKLRSFESLTIRNSVFTEIFDDQENLIHLRTNGNVRSCRTTGEVSSCELSFK